MNERRHFTSRPCELRRRARLTEATFFQTEAQQPHKNVLNIQRDLAKKMKDQTVLENTSTEPEAKQ